MTYKTSRGLVQAVRKLETTSPEYPIKGHGHKRYELNNGAEALAAICGKEIKNGNHFNILFARRSKRGNIMGYDQEVISPEMYKLVTKNTELFNKLAFDFKAAQRWADATTHK